MAPKRKVVSVKKKVVKKSTVEVAVLETDQSQTLNESLDQLTTTKTTTTTTTKPKPKQKPKPREVEGNEERDVVKKTVVVPVEDTTTPRNENPAEPKTEGLEGTEEPKPPPTTKKRKRRSAKSRLAGREEYKRYVFRVLKQVHPGMTISTKAMTIINNMMNDMFERLADEAAKLTAYTKRATLSAREIQGAVRLVLPGDLSRHAIAEGAKAVTAYTNSDL